MMAKVLYTFEVSMPAKVTLSIIFAVLFAGTYAWVNRYEVQTLSNAPGCIIIDRWTGETCFAVFQLTAPIYRCLGRSQREQVQSKRVSAEDSN